MNSDQPESTQRVLLDLGRVADIAELRINGQLVTTLWAPPFRADITDFVKTGSNLIEVAVTNTWHNRLAYDAALPPNKRRTLTISGPDFEAPLIKAGIIGPVVVRTGQGHPLQP